MKLHLTDELIKDSNEALDMLKDGNQRFVDGVLSKKTGYHEARSSLESGQYPFAVVVCCSDSRVAPEIFFDQRLGDIFTVRNAGNVIDETALGSIEYAAEHLHSPLVVVCGHSHCGAVTAAVEGGDLPPNIKSITDRIQPAKEMGGDVDDVIRNHVTLMVKQVEGDPLIQELGTKVVGAYYDIVSGFVHWQE